MLAFGCLASTPSLMPMSLASGAQGLRATSSHCPGISGLIAWAAGSTIMVIRWKDAAIGSTTRRSGHDTVFEVN
jgi:hypothetical protein